MLYLVEKFTKINKRFNLINDQFLSEIERILLLFFNIYLQTLKSTKQTLIYATISERTDCDL